MLFATPTWNTLVQLFSHDGWLDVRHMRMLIKFVICVIMVGKINDHLLKQVVWA